LWENAAWPTAGMAMPTHEAQNSAPELGLAGAQ
jgi:hypothetical protein